MSMTDWDEVATRPAVQARSGGVCECCCKARATEMHHRIPRSVGGPWTPANIVHVCHDCHFWMTEYPQAARAKGWHLYSTESPTRIPITRRSGQIVLLSDDVSPPRRRPKSTRPVRRARSLGRKEP